MTKEIFKWKNFFITGNCPGTTVCTNDPGGSDGPLEKGFRGPVGEGRGDVGVSTGEGPKEDGVGEVGRRRVTSYI